MAGNIGAGAETIRIEIEGMNCNHCVAAVRRALEKMEGVEVHEVRVGSAEVAYAPASASPEAIARTIEDEGYGVLSSSRA